MFKHYKMKGRSGGVLYITARLLEELSRFAFWQQEVQLRRAGVYLGLVLSYRLQVVLLGNRQAPY
jgi:hypothetical protein